tara:strand:- start:3338 stop:3580 length:243 start_codon:yes stop_codon:yes gene_type:complete
LSDDTCIITPNEWDHLSNVSYAAYHLIKKIGKHGIEVNLKNGDYTYVGEVPDNVFSRVHTGVTISDETEERMLRYFEKMS